MRNHAGFWQLRGRGLTTDAPDSFYSAIDGILLQYFVELSACLSNSREAKESKSRMT